MTLQNQALKDVGHSDNTTVYQLEDAHDTTTADLVRTVELAFDFTLQDEYPEDFKEGLERYDYSIEYDSEKATIHADNGESLYTRILTYKDIEAMGITLE